MTGPIAVIGLDPPVQETVHELIFYYADLRPGAQTAFVGSGFYPILSDGDTVVTGGSGGYVVTHAATKTREERVVRIAPGYLWVEERVYTREKKPIKPKAKES